MFLNFCDRLIIFGIEIRSQHVSLVWDKTIRHVDGQAQEILQSVEVKSKVEYES